MSDHFVRTAELVNGLTRSYKAVFEHLEGGAYRLVGEETLRKRLSDNDVEVDSEPVRLEYLGSRRLPDGARRDSDGGRSDSARRPTDQGTAGEFDGRAREDSNEWGAGRGKAEGDAAPVGDDIPFPRSYPEREPENR